MGHVFSVDFPKEYNNWGAVEPVELFDAPTMKLEANPKVQCFFTISINNRLLGSCYETLASGGKKR